MGLPLMTRRRLPAYIADGPEVSELAYRIVERALAATVELGGDTSEITIVDVVQNLALDFEVDEADVLRALAELVDVGAYSIRT
jgi:hypothetical protein